MGVAAEPGWMSGSGPKLIFWVVNSQISLGASQAINNFTSGLCVWHPLDHSGSWVVVTT